MEGINNTKWARWTAGVGGILAVGGGLYQAVIPQTGLAGFYISGAGLILLLATMIIVRKKLGGILGARAFRMGAGSAVSVLAVLALVVFLGALAARYNYRLDVTQGRVYTLAEQSLKVLEKLDQPVTALAFYRQAQPDVRGLKELLAQYAYKNRLFSYRFVDPDMNPALAKSLGVRDYRTLVLQKGARSETIKNPTEEALTNALIRLTREGVKVVYFLSGHGEHPLEDASKKGYSGLQKALEKQNFKVKPLILATMDAVPGDAALLVAAGPRHEILSEEKKRLDEYLNRGGSLLFLMDVKADAGIQSWLAERGAVLGDDIIFDQTSRLFGASPAWPLAADYAQHRITGPLKGVFCIFPLARSVRVAKKLPAGASGVELVRTSPQAWGEHDWEALTKGSSASFDEKTDEKGPLSLAVLINLAPVAKAGDKNAKKPPMGGKLAVFGDSDFVDNTNLNQAGNRDLILNTVSFLAEEGDLVAVRPKEHAFEPLLLTPLQARILFWAPLLILPLFFALIGIWVTLKRRRPA